MSSLRLWHLVTCFFFFNSLMWPSILVLSEKVACSLIVQELVLLMRNWVCTFEFSNFCKYCTCLLFDSEFASIYCFIRSYLCMNRFADYLGYSSQDWWSTRIPKVHLQLVCWICCQKSPLYSWNSYQVTHIVLFFFILN